MGVPISGQLTDEECLELAKACELEVYKKLLKERVEGDTSITDAIRAKANQVLAELRGKRP